MAVSVSAVVVLGIVVFVFVFIWGGSVRLLFALACAGCGFFLAFTGAAPLISGAIGTVTGWIASI